jgi:hypothetical protein
LLVPALQSAFEDSELSADEMRELATLIAQVEHQWGQQLKTQGSNFVEATAAPGEDAPRMLPEPRLPTVSRIVRLTCRISEQDYEVNLSNHSCQCAEWVSIRNRFALGTLGRCCKHVAQALAGQVRHVNFEPWMAAVLEDCKNHGRGINPDFRWHLLDFPEGIAAISKGEGQWANVFAPAQEGYERFGFNTVDRRWSYGVAPRREKALVEAIDAHL